MKRPNLGKQTFLPDNPVASVAFEKATTKQMRLPSDEDQQPLYTGRYLVLLKEDKKSFSAVNKVFKSKAGMKVASVSDFAGKKYDEQAIADADVLTYDHIGVALVGGDATQIQMLEDNSNDDYIVLPEKVVYVPDDLPSITMEKATWGLQAVGVVDCEYTGKNVKIAVLDTGFDSAHPDFAGRKIVTQSFVTGETFTDDRHGHGTHCIGTACGGVDENGVRYGIASESHIYAGKVLSSQGSGAQQFILDGMLWATENGCKVISMSLGSKVLPFMSYDLAYERAANYALSQGAIVVAAAGNDSKRSIGLINPVSSPADCPSIFAVAAVDKGMNVANFSNRGINVNGMMDIAAPGVDVYSSWPMPKRYNQISGTSMATPHVAGLLALFWEQYPNYTPEQVWLEMVKFVKTLNLPAVDVGKGFAQSPCV